MNGEALVKLIEEMIDLKLQQHVQANHNLAGLVRWPRLGENPRNNGLHAMQPNNNVGRSSPSMTLEQFWNIVEKAHRASGGDMDKKCVLLDAELRRLPLEEVRSFLGHFDECCDRAYSWELWAAAYTPMLHKQLAKMSK